MPDQVVRQQVGDRSLDDIAPLSDVSCAVTGPRNTACGLATLYRLADAVTAASELGSAIRKRTVFPTMSAATLTAPLALQFETGRMVVPCALATRRTGWSYVMADISGNCDSRFASLRGVVSDLIDAGEDVGSSVAVFIEGRPVVDIWGGWIDVRHSVPWGRNTLTNVWSTTKTMAALSALILVDRGQLDLDSPVDRYWPEFARNGKEHVLVRHVMSHTSGVSGWESPFQVSDLYDWEKSTGLLAAQAPWWEPGTASGYHAINYGHLIGEVVRRITGKKLGQFFAEEVAGPLGADFYIGLPDSQFSRVASVIPPPRQPLPDRVAMDSVMMKTFSVPALDASDSWSSRWRRADIGGANGHGNAHSVARAQAIITNGGTVDGVRLLSPQTIDLIFQEQSNGLDLVLGVPIRFGVGYALEVAAQPYIPTGRVCFWGGWGGSIVVNDVERQMTLSYIMNKMSPGLVDSASGRSIVEATYAALE